MGRDCLCRDADDRFRALEDRVQSSHDLWKSSHVLDKAAAVLFLLPQDRAGFAAVVERSFPVRFPVASDGFQLEEDLSESSA